MGRLALIDAISRAPGRDRLRSDFWFVLFFGHLLPPRELDAAIEARLAARRRELAVLERCETSQAPPGERFVYSWGVIVMRAELDYLENNRHELLGAILKGDSGEGDWDRVRTAE